MVSYDILHISQSLDFPIFEFSICDDFLKFGSSIEENGHDQL